MQNLRKRFHLSLTEEVSKISHLDDNYTALTELCFALPASCQVPWTN